MRCTRVSSKQIFSLKKITADVSFIANSISFRYKSFKHYLELGVNLNEKNDVSTMNSMAISNRISRKLPGDKL